MNGIYFKLISPLYNGRAHFEQVHEQYDCTAPDAVFNLGYFQQKKLIPEHIRLEGLLYNNSAFLSLTDNLTASFINESDGLIVHKRLLQFILQFNLPEYKIFPLSFEVLNCQNNDYLFIYFKNIDLTRAIDFNASTFYAAQDPNMQNIRFEDQNDYEYFLKNSKTTTQLNSKKLSLNKTDAILQKDILSIGQFNRGLFMSHRMKTALNALKYSGFRYKQYKFLD